jgi:hypothetical protein
MVRVAKPGSAIWINVNRNEAINASYNGLHSWNFEELYDTLLIWNPSRATLFEQIVDGLPFKWSTHKINAKKFCPEEIDIVVYKDGIDFDSMTVCGPGIRASITGRHQFLTIWAPGDLDERYNFFVHGLNKAGNIIFNKSFRWYNTLRRRSLKLPLSPEVVALRLGQFDVKFDHGQPVYSNTWRTEMDAREKPTV